MNNYTEADSDVICRFALLLDWILRARNVVITSKNRILIYFDEAKINSSANAQVNSTEFHCKAGYSALESVVVFGNIAEAQRSIIAGIAAVNIPLFIFIIILPFLFNRSFSSLYLLERRAKRINLKKFISSYFFRVIMFDEWAILNPKARKLRKCYAICQKEINNRRA